MANERRAAFNFVSGTLSSSLTNVATSMSSAGLANLGVIDSTNYAAIAIENEIVWVTAHTGGATTATILRAQEGTSAVAHSAPAAWQHGPTALDLSRLWNPPTCRLTKSGLQTLANATDVALTWDQEAEDTDSMHSLVTNTSRITINTAGLYLVEGLLMYNANATGARICAVRLNGASWATQSIMAPSGASDGTGVPAIIRIKLAIADFVELYGFQRSGGSLDVVASVVNHFSATYIGTG